MSCFRSFLSGACIIGCSFVSSNASAELITYYFSGNFELVGSQFPPTPALAGTSFTGSFTYDTGAPVLLLGGNFINYVPGSAQLSIQTVLGSGQTSAGVFGEAWDFSGSPFPNGATNPIDRFSVAGSATFEPGLAGFSAINVQLSNGTGGTPGDPFGNNLSPPPTVLPLAQMDAAELSLSSPPRAPGVFAAGNLRCLSTSASECSPVSSVPEPTMVALLGFGLAGLAFSRRKHDRESPRAVRYQTALA